jgi:AsmA protein
MNTDGARPPTTKRPVARGGDQSWLVYAAVSLVGLVVGVGSFILANAPTEAIRDDIAAAVKAETGRELSVSGGASFHLFPSPGLNLRDVTLAAPAGMGGGPTLAIAELDVTVAPWALLAGRIEVQRVTIRRPVLDLRIDAAGRRSWDRAELAPVGRVRLADAGGSRNDASPAAPEAGRQRPPHVKVGSVDIEGARVSFRDDRYAKSAEIERIDGRLTLDPAEGPARISGTMVAAGEAVGFEASLGSVDGLIRKTEQPLVLHLKGAPLEMTLEGKLRVDQEIGFGGHIVARSPSARQLIGWLGTRLPPSGGFGPLTFSGDLRVEGPALSLSDGAATLDGATANGDIAVDTRGARPHVTARLGVSRLDLDLYSALAGEVPANPSGGTRGDDASRVKGFVGRAGWSEEPIDTTLLGLVDGQANLRLGGLKVRGIDAGAAAATVTLEGKRLVWRLEKADLYSGEVRGTVSADASTVPLRLMVDLSGTGISMQPLLRDGAAFDWLAGKGNVVVKLRGEGASERDVVASLAGGVDVDLADGAIVGFNVAKVLRGIGQGRFGDFDRVASERTDFSEMKAHFAVANGVASNQDLKVVSPLLRVSGAGKIELTERRIDYTARPRLVASLTGQGSTEPQGETAKGLEIPVRITGSLDKPDIHADVAGILKDPDKTIEAVKEIGRQLGGKKTGDFLDKLFGKR